jgi:hypothetical protein
MSDVEVILLLKLSVKDLTHKDVRFGRWRKSNSCRTIRRILDHRLQIDRVSSGENQPSRLETKFGKEKMRWN